MNKPHLIDTRERGALSEKDLSPIIKQDPASFFASDENMANFQHFYHLGHDDTIIKLRLRVQTEINDARLRQGGGLRDAYVDGLKKALSLIW